MLETLKAEVLEANLELVRRGLVLYTFGNASGIDRASGHVVIKPSGVDYAKLRPEHMVVTDVDGNLVEGNLKPSSDLQTHLVLYKHFAEIGAVVHTHSEYATAWAQSGRDLPALGTTHADSFHGPVPCTPQLSDAEIEEDYVRNTGLAIVRRFMREFEIPGLALAIVTPRDVLIQPHSAPLGMIFYEGAMFPPEYRGDAFVALHGSWNRAKRTGYKVVRLRMRDGQPTGEYEDFLTGLVDSDSSVWARPVDVAVAHDGALLMTEDGNGTIWRVAFTR